MPSRSSTLYYQVIDVTKRYLGPAAERFITRQIETHLNKRADKLTKKDLQQLLDWIRVAMALLTDDRKLIEDYMNNLGELARK